MKNNKLQLMLAGLFLCAAAMPVFAGERSGEEKKLEAAAGELDKTSSEGQQRVLDRIKAEFGVEEGLIIGLRFKKLGDGEIAIALSLARQLHRTINDEDLHQIVALRQGPPVMGWGNIAKKLGLKLGPALSQVRKVSAGVRKDEKSDKAKEAGKKEAEKAGKSGKSGMPGKKRGN